MAPFFIKMKIFKTDVWLRFPDIAATIHIGTQIISKDKVCIAERAGIRKNLKSIIEVMLCGKTRKMLSPCVVTVALSKPAVIIHYIAISRAFFHSRSPSCFFHQYNKSKGKIEEFDLKSFPIKSDFLLRFRIRYQRILANFYEKIDLVKSNDREVPE